METKEAEKIIRKTSRIQGWFAFEAAMLFAWIDEIQKSDDIYGDIFEIGVYHGKSAVLLGAMLNPAKEKLGACDLFERRSNSLPGTAFGDREIFEHNMKKCLGADLQMRIFAKPSTELTAEEIGRNYRFIHIDGGHGADDVFHDLQLAASAIIEAGVIALDDAIAVAWPGVIEAIFRFLSRDKRFRAIVAGFNKMLLVRHEFADLYTREIDDEELRVTRKITYPWRLKKVPFMNHPLRIFYIPPDVSIQSFHSRWKYYDRHNWLKNPLLRPMVLLAKSIVGRRL